MFTYTANGELKIQKKNKLIEGFDNSDLIDGSKTNVLSNNDVILKEDKPTFPIEEEMRMKINKPKKIPSEDKPKKIPSEDKPKKILPVPDEPKKILPVPDEPKKILPVPDEPKKITVSSEVVDNPKIIAINPEVIDTDVNLETIKNEFENLSLSCGVPKELGTQVYQNDFDKDGNIRVDRFERTLMEVENLISNKKNLKSFAEQYDLKNSGKQQIICILNTYDKYIPNTAPFKSVIEHLITKLNISDDDIDHNIVKRFCINDKCLTKEAIISLYNHINN